MQSSSCNPPAVHRRQSSTGTWVSNFDARAVLGTGVDSVCGVGGDVGLAIRKTVGVYIVNFQAEVVGREKIPGFHVMAKGVKSTKL